jgi:transcriptional regulator with XRE-family HTH domain
MDTLADRLKQLRSEKRLTQLEVAQAIGVSHAGYQKYEYSEINPRNDKIKKLANFFGVSVEYLRGETDDRGDGFEIHAHRDPSTPGMPLTAALDIVDRLERLTKLRDSGAITDEEFALAKRKLLK